MNRTIVQTEGLCFAYAEGGAVNPFVLDGVNLDIEEGSFVTVLRHNGSGKSTLAKRLSVILLPSGGRVYVDDINTADEDKLSGIRHTVGMVFQNPDNQIVINMVEEGVAFAPEDLGMPPTEIRRRVDDTLKAVGMYEHREYVPHPLSGGQKQRVVTTGVIVITPRYIMLGEPTTMLGPIGRAEVMKTVRELNRSSGMTVVLITHHMDGAAQANRLVVMAKGQVAADDTPRKVFQRVGKLRVAGLAVPETAELLRQLQQAGVDVSLDALSDEERTQVLSDLLQTRI